MNSLIINNFNQKVKEDDMVFFLGDFVFRSGTKRGEGEKDKPEDFIKQLKCKNIVFIQGNHDKNNSLKTIIQKITIKHGGKRICLVHNPEFCDINYDFNIVGHVHDKWKFKRFIKGEAITDCCNVSVEQWNYYPVDINDINKAYTEWLKHEKKI
jgi:calcineurin-like phosphoesterase family protein